MGIEQLLKNAKDFNIRSENNFGKDESLEQVKNTFLLIDQLNNAMAFHELIYIDDKPDFIIRNMNQEYCNITGFDKKDIINKKLTELFANVSDPQLDRLRLYEMISIHGFDIEYTAFNKDLKPDKGGLWVKVHAYSPIKGTFITKFEDITEKIKTKENEKRLLEIERKYLEDQKELFHKSLENEANAIEIVKQGSHGIRTPIHNIIHFANIGFKKKDINYFDKILSIAKPTSKVIAAYTELSNIYLSLKEVKLSKQCLYETFLDYKKNYEPFYSNNRYNINIEKPDFQTDAIFDPKHLKFAFNHMIDDSIYHSKEISNVDIRFSETEFENILGLKKGIRIDFINDNENIPNREEIKEDIWMLNRLTPYTSTEFGVKLICLPICYKVLQAMNGTVCAKNNKEKGTTFSFILPYR